MFPNVAKRERLEPRLTEPLELMIYSESFWTGGGERLLFFVVIQNNVFLRRAVFDISCSVGVPEHNTHVAGK